MEKIKVIPLVFCVAPSSLASFTNLTGSVYMVRLPHTF